MRIALIYFTEAGGETCGRIVPALSGRGHECQARAGNALEGGLSAWTGEAFHAADALVFVSAAGIAVRAIAPYIKKKTEDPAVVVVDELGLHAISLLSGHMGGANGLTREIAAAIGADPVITTATDINGRLAVDQWAKEQGLYIADMTAAKRVSAALLRKERVGFYSEFPVQGELPRGFYEWRPGSGERCGLKIALCLKDPRLICRGEEILWLAPRVLSVGIGCRRGVSMERIRQGVEEALAAQGLLAQQIRVIASIDIKADEQGLIRYAKLLGVPFLSFSPMELAEAELSGGESAGGPAADELGTAARGQAEMESQGKVGCKSAAQSGFASSEFVRSITGVDNVCERAAVLAAAAGQDGAGRAWGGAGGRSAAGQSGVAAKYGDGRAESQAGRTKCEAAEAESAAERLESGAGRARCGGAALVAGKTAHGGVTVAAAVDLSGFHLYF